MAVPELLTLGHITLYETITPLALIVSFGVRFDAADASSGAG